MVSTRSRGRPRTLEKPEKDEAAPEGNENGTQYEESRALRIKENEERMKSLGILDLSKKLKRPSSKPHSSARINKPDVPSDPPRRSSRLTDMPRVNYKEKNLPKKEIPEKKNVEIHIPIGEKPEIYTEEHGKLLGDSKATWVLHVDGMDDEGHRVYDSFEGKTCHQCRQKTLGHHTECSRCEGVSGQLCGDCLYSRYGEHVLEVKENPDWICPFCRGICNCSRCRRDNGWMPTGQIYGKVKSLGFKSVAHYLIHTRHERAIKEAEAGETARSLVSVVEGEEDSSDSGGKKDEIEDGSKKDDVEDDRKKDEAEDGGKKDEMKVDSDEDYRGDEDDEDDEAADSEDDE